MKDGEGLPVIRGGDKASYGVYNQGEIACINMTGAESDDERVNGSDLGSL